MKIACGLLGVVISFWLGGCAAPASPSASSPTSLPATAIESSPPPVRELPIEAPRLGGMAIDGDDADWQDRGARVDVLSPASPGNRGDADAALRLAWDERGLLVLIHLHDAKAAELGWKGSGIELLLATDDISRDMVQATLTPAMEKNGNLVVRTTLRDARQSKTLRQIKMSVQSAVGRRASGVSTIETLLPWDQLGITPSNGTKINVQVAVNSAAPGGERSRLIWYPVDGANFNRSRMRSVKLADKASPPVEGVAGGTYERLQRLRIEVATLARYAGQTAALRDGERVIGKTELVAAGRLALGNMVLAVPGIGKTYRDLAIYVGNDRVSKVEVDDLDRVRKRTFDEAFFVFNSFVFSGPTFPKPEFDNASLVDDAAGVCKIKTIYYDAGFKQVTRPTTFGRYGAIVEATSEQGWTIKRYYTLYRHEKPLPRDNAVGGTFELAREFGIDAAVGREQGGAVGEGINRAMRANLSRNHDMATILAGLAEMPAGTGPAPKRLGVWERNGQWWYALRKSIGDMSPYAYVARVPDSTPPANGKWPVLIFLHGMGERGSDLKRVAVNGPLKEIAAGRSLPFVVVAPQCPGDEWWSSLKLSEMLDEVIAKYPVDVDRIYLTGLSMGGFGTWAWSFHEPDRFAAIAPVCGGGDAPDAARIQNLPTWVFHGGKDPTVRVEESYLMVKALRDLNARVRFTLYPNTGHDSWTETYGNPALYEWLLQQRRGQPAEPKSAVPGTQPTLVVE